LRRIRLAVKCALVVAGASLAAGCSGEDGHIRPWGMVIREGTQILVHARGSTVDGSLSVRAGEESPDLVVRFLGRNGEELQVVPYHLEVWSADAGIAEFRPDTVGAFEGRLEGSAPGTTTLLFRWMHGRVGEAHKDRDWAVDVTVRP
jgi:hypothetical protein